MIKGSNELWVLPFVIAASGLLILCVCLPLIYRKIPMNHFYGVRIRQSFVSTERWYEINEYGGRLLAYGSCVVILTGLAGFLTPPRYFLWYAGAAMVVVLVSVLLPVVQTMSWAKAIR
jgi:uncharacterized membrane protein